MRVFFQLRKSGLSDVLTKRHDPSSKIGIVVRVRGRPKNRPWVFLPLRSFRLQFPVSGIHRGNKRSFAVDAYFDACAKQAADQYMDSLEGRIIDTYRKVVSGDA